MVIFMRFRNGASLLLILLIAACARTIVPDSAETYAPDAPLTQAQQPTIPAGIDVVVPEDSRLIYRRAGGLAGLDEEWTIYLDGRVQKPDGTVQEVNSVRARELFENVLQDGFFDLADSYGSADTCCDRLIHTITVVMDDQTKTVSTIDEAPSQPETLTSLLKGIYSILN